MRRHAVYFALFISALAGAGMASAEGWKPNFRWGKLEFHPSYKQTRTYDSNIYLVPKDKADSTRVGSGVRSAWITQDSLNLRFALPMDQMHRFDVGYGLDSLLYSRQSEANDTLNQKVDGAYGFKHPMGISAKLGGNYMNTTDPAFSELVERERRWQGGGNAAVDYAPEGGSLTLGVDGGHTVNKYVSRSLGALLNRYEQNAGIRVGWKLQPKTRLYVGYRRGIIHYTAGRNADSKSHSVDLGVEGIIAPKLTGQIQAGMQHRKYDQDASTQNPRGRFTNDLSVATRLTWKPMDRTQVSLGVSRSINEATFGDNHYYHSTSFNLGVSHKLPYRLTVSVNGSAGVDRYPTAASPNNASRTTGTVLDRRDDIHQVSTALDYDITEWMRTGVGYLYRTRWSKNFTDQFNYQDHQGSVNIGFTF